MSLWGVSGEPLVGAATFKLRAEGVKKLLAWKYGTLKQRPCIVVDPLNQDVRLELHCVLYNVHADQVRTVLGPYGKVTNVTRDQ